MEKKTTEQYLEFLGLTIKSTKEEIKSAYRTAIKKWHPDKFNNDKQKNREATEKSKLINEAYNILKNYEPPHLKESINHSPPNTKSGKKNERSEIIRIKVESSNIYSIGYDKLKKIVQIQFINGGIYEYYDVPENVYIQFMSAESKGKFASRNIYYSYKNGRIN